MHHNLAIRLISLCWIVFTVYWAASWTNTRRAAKHAPLGQEGFYRVLTFIGWVLIALPFRHFPAIGRVVLPASHIFHAAGVLICAFGVGFAIWARRTLGASWNSKPIVQEGHQLVRSGPYALARHPIYTGMLMAFLGSAMVRGSIAAIVGFAVLIFAFWYKLSIEERFMTETFGDEYAQYKREVKALIPGIV